MKRIPAVLFLLLANMVLFVHAVIPHHHHNSNLCFDAMVAEQATHEDCCSTACNTGQDEHDSDKDSDNCTLSHIVALFNGEIKQNICGHISSHELIYPVSLLALEASVNSSISNPHFFNEVLFNKHIPIYHSVASQAFGLRAPPFFC